MQPIAPPVRHLMGPGPSPVEPSVLAAMNRPVIGHLDPEFIAIMDDLSDGLREVFRTGNRMTFPVSGTGSAGMEAAVHNVLEPGDRLVVGVNGVFGGRLADAARRAGADVTVVSAPWGKPVPTGDLAAAVRRAVPRAVAVVHAETSTGVRQPVEELRKAIGEEPLLIVDTVTSLAGIPVDVDAWGIDVAFSGTQKCLSVPPGLAPITFSDRAVDAALKRREPVRSWYFDLRLLAGYWKDGSQSRAYHHTAPISMVYALHEGVRLVLAEGLDARWRRHEEVGRFLVSSFEGMGFEPLADSRYRLPQLSAVRVPDGYDEAALRAALLHDHGIEVGAGLGEFTGEVWRIGLMGAGARKEHALRLIQATAAVMAGYDHRS
jgi:alanine-glyoxylate transaminase/serine-glyoxylate transaminase/serine-pyruvate transaminase